MPEPAITAAGAPTHHQVRAHSSDGQWLLVGHTPDQPQPHTLQLFDATLQRVRTWNTASAGAVAPLRVAAVVDAAPRRSFIVALHDVAELWEISYDPRAEDIHTGLVHDYRMGESLPVRGFHNIRRTALDAPLRAPYFDPEFTHVAAALPRTDGTAALAQIVNLDVRRQIAVVPIAGTLGPGRVERGPDGKGWLWLPRKQPTP